MRRVNLNEPIFLVVARSNEFPLEIRTLTQATICCLLVFDEKAIRDVETEAAFVPLPGSLNEVLPDL